MTPQDFCYWLQGFFELSTDGITVTPEQVLIIKDHLKLVFDKQTPDRNATQPFDYDKLKKELEELVKKQPQIPTPPYVDPFDPQRPPYAPLYPPLWTKPIDPTGKPYVVTC